MSFGHTNANNDKKQEVRKVLSNFITTDFLEFGPN